jgi:hypothetical protein
MTAGEDQPQTVVLNDAVVVIATPVTRFLAGPQRGTLPQLGGLGRAAAQAIERATTCSVLAGLYPEAVARR